MGTRFAKATVLGVLLLSLLLLRTLHPQAHPHTAAETQAFLSAHQEQYEQAITRARAWLMPLRADPVVLRQHGVKGKKKLVELIDTWVRLYQVADELERGEILAHIEAMALMTHTVRYHDMLELDDETFKQDATSYLRAAYLLDQLGLDITFYRDQIGRVQPRLDAHLHRRGPNQQYMFHVYYRHFGLREPFPLEGALENGVIAGRAPADTMDSRDVYALTHEVFGPYDYGNQLDVLPFDDDELRYLRTVLPALVMTWMGHGNPDLVAELVSCLRFIRAVDLPAYTEGLTFLLQAQHPDGHWGDYAPEAAKIGAWATTYKLELHTTAVAIDALTIAFHPAWNQRVVPIIPPEPTAGP